MLVLGVESSCDETAAAVTRGGREVLSNIIYSQAGLHSKYGGVVPEIASRKHIEKILPVIDEALSSAGVSKGELGAVAVTSGPGLVGALLVGVSVAKALAFAIKKPLVPVNHISGHVAANYIAHRELKPPFVCLIASGGHSHIVLVKDYTSFTLLGATLDDAAGEAFDKVARVLGLGYPGGPLLSRAASEGDENAVYFPRPVKGADFSFSGVKTAVINHIHKLNQKGEAFKVSDIAASFQRAVVDVLVGSTIRAALSAGADKLALAGGVAANELLRRELRAAAEKAGLRFFCPPEELCTDNAAMISAAGYYNFKFGVVAGLDLNAKPHLPAF